MILNYSATTQTFELTHDDGHKRVIPKGEAEWLWKMGKLKDYNLAMGRVAAFNFDLNAVEASYQLEQEAIDRGTE